MGSLALGLVSAMLALVPDPFPDRPWLASPDQRIELRGSLPAQWPRTSQAFGVFFRQRELARFELGLVVRGEGDRFRDAAAETNRPRSHRERVATPFGKASHARNDFNELEISFRSPSGGRVLVRFRCFDDAVAFRYELPREKGVPRVVIEDETTRFSATAGTTAYFQSLENHRTSHEHNVQRTPLEELPKNTLFDLPLTFTLEDGASFAFTEAALRRYAGLSLMRTDDSASLRAKLTPRPDGAKVDAALPLATPWRVILIGDRVGDLLESQTLYCLNEPPAFKDRAWIKPGKMTWPWWNGHLFEANPTRPILALETLKSYIDFCAEQRIAFHSVVSDEQDRPWYVQKVDGLFPGPGTEVTQVRADLDLPAVLKYARSKGVRLWTWVHQGTLRGKVDDAFTAFEKMGWSGMMVDFFDHDDQDTVEFAEEILQAAARHHLLIHFHGIWKPTGLQRTYPNLMNHEGVLNLEYLKWGDACPPEHDLRIAFTRAIAGPLDYHLGGFRAVNRRDFKPKNVGPNVLGTRCHQLAMYVGFDNPNPMVADFPAAYRDQPGFEFIREVPTWWDETRVLAGEAGKVLVVARRKGREWWLGGLWAGPPGVRSLDLRFLGRGKFDATIWSDSAASEFDPNQLARTSRTLDGGSPLTVSFGTDGGFVGRLIPSK